MIALKQRRAKGARIDKGAEIPTLKRRAGRLAAEDRSGRAL